MSEEMSCEEIIGYINKKIDEIGEHHESIGLAKEIIKNIKVDEKLTERQKENNIRVIEHNIKQRKEVIWGKKDLIQGKLKELKRCELKETKF